MNFEKVTEAMNECEKVIREDAIYAANPRLLGPARFATHEHLEHCIDMIRRLIPARANFLGDEFVVESHMLERPKMQWNYRRQQGAFQPEGAIKVYIRT